MTFEEYKKLSIRTLPFLGETYDISSYDDDFPKILDSIHMTLGMMSELSELSSAIKHKDPVNIAEELADIIWYVSGECYIRNINLTLEFSELNHKLENVEFKVLLINLSDCISEYSDLVKKEFAYRKIKESHFYQLHLSTIFNSVANVANCFNINMEKALQNNIDKLKARYPNKFNENDAINRNLNNERKELEK